MTSSGWTGESRTPGQRRQKVLGYIKAANELRQTYQQTLSTRWNEGGFDEGMPGAFPDADVVRNGDEEMLIFPSYARKHIKMTHLDREPPKYQPGTRGNIESPAAGDAEYWRREWERYEDENAIVDVDVRGWIYSPQRGPLNRKNRLLLAVARRLSGIPTLDPSPSHSRESSRGPGFRERVHEDLLGQEEEAAAREAEILTRHGQREAENASKGAYNTDNNSLLEFSPTNSRSSSPPQGAVSRSTLGSELESGTTATLSAAQKRQSWSNPATMSREEIQIANEQLTSRLRPFMTSPLASTPITIFFYNENKSISKSVYTDESGHFKVRAALDFTPKQVRVLASENLSATEDVVVTESQGISLISDIDDTIKHSAIASGAKEIFKNTFLRELGELTVQGVKEWYSKMASLGVKLHYVSNSPWQLYPLLKSYFALAGLPPGSFHLKQYSGMLQGIFEPAAERKKGSLDRIMHDFPERQFILVGDSGEADLEVYTDIVQEHPGRVLGVFIRDVTNARENNLRDFFDGASPTSPSDSHGGTGRRNAMTGAEDYRPDNSRPDLPERPKRASAATDDLIDFSDSPSPNTSRSPYHTDLDELQHNGKASPQPPNKPTKPSSLRSFSTASQRPTNHDRSISASDTGVKKAPPPPTPRRTGTGLSIASSTNSLDKVQSKPLPPPPAPRSGRPSPTSRTATDQGYLASARHQLSTAYNALPPLRSQSPTRDVNDPNGPPLPPRRGLSSYPAAAARWATGASGGDPAAGGDGGAVGAPYDKKVELWKRRWAKAEEIMKRNHVMLKTWRKGGDVMQDCVRLVEQAQREMRK